MRTNLLAIPAAVFLAAGCVGPEDKSTEDYERHRAAPLALGQSQPDSVDTKGGDRSDWKFIELQDTGFLTVELILDDPSANVTITLFDRYGKPVPGGRSSHRAGEHPLLKVTTDVGVGRYFVLVQAAGKSDATGYAIKAYLR